MENIEKCISLCERKVRDSLTKGQKRKLEGCDENPSKVHRKMTIGNSRVDVKGSVAKDKPLQQGTCTATNPENVLDVQVNRDWLKCLRESCRNVNKSHNTPETFGIIDLTDDADERTVTGEALPQPIVNRPIAPTCVVDVYMDIVQKVKQDPSAKRKILHAIKLLSSRNMFDQSQDKQSRHTFTATNPGDVLDVDINQDWLKCLRESRL